METNSGATSELRALVVDELHAQIRPHLEQVRAGRMTQYERQHRRSDGGISDLAVTFLPQQNAASRRYFGAGSV